MNTYIKLDSVGAIIDDKAIVYPQNPNGTADLSSGTHVTELSDEFKDSLSEEDGTKIMKAFSFARLMNTLH